MAAAPTTIDTLAQIQTPEGILLELRAAGLMPRALAWLIDLCIRFAIFWVAMIALGILGEAGTGILLIAMFALIWAYPILCEGFFNGQTVGKRVMGLRTVNQNGTPVTWLPAIIRNLMRTVDMLPVLYGVGIAALLMDQRARRVGDWVAGTVVIYVDPPMVLSQVPPLPSTMVNTPLSLAERGAIIAYAERFSALSPQRQIELANLLSEFSGSTEQQAVQRLISFANGYLGRP